MIRLRKHILKSLGMMKMAKKKRKPPKYLTIYNNKHKFIWWLFIGWWWRPTKYAYYILLSTLCGFKKIKIVTK